MTVKQSACFIIHNPTTGKVMATTRRRLTEADPVRLGLPGGKLDAGESHMRAALRETVEETGIEIDLWEIAVDRFSQVLHSDNGSGDMFETVCFYAVHRSETIPGGIETGIDSFWVDPHELIDNSPFSDYNRAALEFFGVI